MKHAQFQADATCINDVFSRNMANFWQGIGYKLSRRIVLFLNLFTLTISCLI